MSNKRGVSSEPRQRLTTLRWPLSFCYFLLLLTAPLSAAQPKPTNDSQCNCYMTSTTEERSFFTSHKFFDFRNLAQYQGVPTSLDDVNDSAEANPSSDYFTNPPWTDTWSIKTWNNSNDAHGDATVYMQNTASNVYIEANTDDKPSSETYLSLRTARLSEFQSAAEIQSIDEGYHFLSMRMFARTRGSPGACTAYFTYLEVNAGSKSSTDPIVQEADAEMLTSRPLNSIQYTNQPSVDSSGDVIAQATRSATLPNSLKWSDWAVHRLDWTPRRSAWSVDGVSMAEISFQVPREPASVILNAWSDGGTWTGLMEKGGVAYLQVQWLDLVYNSTEMSGKTARKKAKGCKVVCSVDETKNPGRPVMLWESGAGRVRQGVGAWELWVVAAIFAGMRQLGSGFSSFRTEFVRDFFSC